MLAPEDQNFVDDKNGAGWGNRCYNLALIDEATPAPKGACEWLRQSASVRPGVGAVQEKIDSLKCRELLAR